MIKKSVSPAQQFPKKLKKKNETDENKRKCSLKTVSHIHNKTH